MAPKLELSFPAPWVDEEANSLHLCGSLSALRLLLGVSNEDVGIKESEKLLPDDCSSAHVTTLFSVSGVHFILIIIKL